MSTTGGAGDADDHKPDDLWAAVNDEDAVMLRNYRQGDLLTAMTSLVALDGTGQSTLIPSPLGAVLASQTCDVVLPHRPAVQVAPRIQLDDNIARDARDGKYPRYAHLPGVGQQDFADLDLVVTISKSHLARHDRVPGVLDERQRRSFARAVARKFSRFPFPDEVAPWLRPLEKAIASKHRREESPEGQLTQEHVLELRVEAHPNWDELPLDLTLCIIVQPGTLPMFPGDELPQRPDELASWLGANRSAGAIANRLLRATEPAERHFLWHALGDAWAGQCRPTSGASVQVASAVTGVVAEVVSADEFPLTRVRNSETLDLDHLSDPTHLT